MHGERQNMRYNICMDEHEFDIPLNQEKNVRADAARNRERLLKSAQRLFADQGIEVVTMSAIAKDAGVGKGTLYRHFADKAAVCHALLDEDMRVFQQQTLLALQASSNEVNALRWFLKEATDYVVKHSDLLREVANQGGIEMLSHPAHIWWRQTILGLLERIAPQGDLSYLADTFYAMLDVQTIRFQRRNLGYEVDRLQAGLDLLVDRLLCESD
ncbi:MAG: TetR/AcrR family transcriptional regulator [Anaerolineae bacterium]|nr:TetR/AcrR family transcriptional regulator [Anaerolineae bacterium]